MYVAGGDAEHLLCTNICFARGSLPLLPPRLPLQARSATNQRTVQLVKFGERLAALEQCVNALKLVSKERPFGCIGRLWMEYCVLRGMRV